MKAEVAVPIRARLGEGACLFPDGSVYWVDLLQGRTYQWKNGQHLVGPTYDHEVSKVLPTTRGNAVIGRTSIFFENRLDSCLVKIGEPASNSRGSDACVLPDGSLIFGIVDRDLTPGRGSLKKVTLDGHVRTVVESADIPNGAAVLANGRQMVWVDSPTKRIDVFDLSPDNVPRNRREFAQIPVEMGIPDGLCADADGGVWVAMWGGGSVIRISESGKLDAVVEVGVPHVTSCAFDNENALIVTTASVLIEPSEEPLFPGAGSLWRVDPAIHGAKRAPTFCGS